MTENTDGRHPQDSTREYVEHAIRFTRGQVQFIDDGDSEPVPPDSFDSPTTRRSRPTAITDGGTEANPEGNSAVGSDDEVVGPVPGAEPLVELAFDPVTRVGGSGALAFDSTVDADDRIVVDGRPRATLFRGYETILEGRDPRDAVDLSSRVCGFEGASHAIASSMALEMAYEVEPPPMGVWVRNMGQAAGLLLDLAGHLFLLAGPDYSEAVLGEHNPGVFDIAQNTAAPHADLHGYETVGDIMTALNPWEGELYFRVLRKARRVIQLSSLMVGKYPHPSTAIPGGVTTTIEGTTFTQFYTLIKGLADYAKTIPPLWDDLLDFLLEYVDGFARVGEAPVNLLSTGAWDDPDVYNARYADADEWGVARYSTPGVVVDGKLRTTNLHAIDAGIEEFVARSFYGDWTDGSSRFDETPAGESISANHPWNKETRPAPDEGAADETYTWATAPRWDRHPMETGAHARMWITALADERSNPHIEPTGDGLNLTLPEVARPEMTFRWDIPARLNAAERLRATAYNVPFAGLVCYIGLLEALDLRKQHETHVHTEFTRPTEGTQRGVAFWESGRGSLTHYVVLQEGTIDSYQILAPTTWIVSPEDPFGTPGPCEQAVVSTPLLERTTDADDLVGIDVLRAIRSFDPCMVCAAH